jgi:8-oxo-dGTP pyrophosphatase MutT (NUDIX family)
MASVAITMRKRSCAAAGRATERETTVNEATKELARDIAQHVAQVPSHAHGNPYMRPRNAATLIIIDRKGKEPKVLMGRRHSGHKFMPGKFVFPGGRIEKTDRVMPAASPLHASVAEKLSARPLKPSLTLARGLALAAIRETFEETGLLLGKREIPPAGKVPAGPWSEFVRHGVMPDLAPLRFITRAITPPGRPRRFDTRFFAVDGEIVAGEVGGIIGPDSELVELVWVNLDEARELDLPPITKRVLVELEQRTAAGFGADLPVPFYYNRHNKFHRDEL